ncbi:AI-2E family transporter [Pseudocolwellia sp. AS88]|jgi:predicted PurR-regulated permease PerM|uniref:AI-2E family transporter n=1 Tax=Pseudocolwellia TaxID=2848177 RepID=UPI0026EFE9E4|nr:AI-2E family transporter [Pseudocolwellia sp. AS88]MDO7084434.1 AI-2E family transporter [Pseudocolwellia sp. AS88]
MSLLEKTAKMNSQGVVKALLVTASLFVVLAGLKIAANIVVPFLLSIFIAIICNPLIVKAAKYKIPKPIAIVAIIATILMLVLLLGGLVGQSAQELSELLPQYKAQLKEQFVWLTSRLAEFNIHISSDVLIEYLDPSAAMGFAASLLSGLGGVMANLLLIIITVIFMLFEAPSLPRKIHHALDDPDMKMNQIDRFLSSVNNYLAIKTLVSIATGVCVSLMLWLFGLEFYLLWGVLAFLLNYIPNIGSMIAAVPAVSLAALQLGLGPAGAIGLGYVTINMIMGNVIEPKYLGKGLGLSTLVVFLSLIFWGWLFGTVGMLLSVPLTMIIKIALENSEEGRWFSILLANET